MEGNTRLCAYRRLSKKYKDDSRWKSIKARVLHESVSEEELFYILGTFHIKGKTEWDAYEKAAYIHKMINVLKKSPEEIARQIGKQKKTVEAMLNAYKTMSQKYLEYNDNNNSFTRDELKKYSYFEAFYLQKELAKRATETPAFMEDFVVWVKEDRLKNAQNVRELTKILDNRKACKVFLESDFSEAYVEAIQVLHEHRPDKVDRFYKKMREFRDMIRESEILKIKEEIAENKNKKNEIQQCLKELKKFCRELDVDG